MTSKKQAERNTRAVCVTETKMKVDKETGEILSEEEVATERRFYVDESFFKFYTHGIKNLDGLSSKALMLFFAICSKMDYDGTVCVTGLRKKELQELSGVKSEAVYNLSLKKLKDRGLLVPVVNTDLKVEWGYYLVDPYVCAKGTASQKKRIAYPSFSYNYKRYSEVRKRKEYDYDSGMIKNFWGKQDTKQEENNNPKEEKTC